MYIICNLFKKNIAGLESEPAVPATGVRVWLEFEIPNPYPYPIKNPDRTRRVRSTRDNLYTQTDEFAPPQPQTSPSLETSTQTSPTTATHDVRTQYETPPSIFDATSSTRSQFIAATLPSPTL